MASRITIEPGKRSGEPCVRGLRITVWDVLTWLAGGTTERQILDDYPELELMISERFTNLQLAWVGMWLCEAVV